MTDPRQGDKRPSLGLLQTAGIDAERVAKRQRIVSHTPRVTESFAYATSEPFNELQYKLEKNSSAGNTRTQTANFQDDISDRGAHVRAIRPLISRTISQNETDESQRTCDKSTLGRNDLDNTKNLNPSPSPEILNDHSIAECNTCFGMIQLPALNLHLSTLGEIGHTRIEVTLRFQSQRIMVCHSESMAYGGLLERRYSEALIDLSERFGLVFDAYLLLNKKSKSASQNYMLCIVLQGHRENADQIGSLLNDAEIYLQAPRAFYKPLVHFNPQYLYRPPNVNGDLNIEETDQSDQDIVGRAGLADDDPLRISIHQTIDSAIGPQKYAEITASPRLQTPLKPHQLKALSMMVEKESGKIEGNDFDSMWTMVCDSNGRKRYRNTVTGFIQSETPVPCLGGILADEMGLGKTLSMLALITLKLDEIENVALIPSRSHTTIIVTPMSLLQTWEEQIKSHIHPGGVSYYKYHGSSTRILLANLYKHDVVLTTYDTLVFEGQRKRHDNKETESLLDLEWFRVVLDEAHLIRNIKSKRHRAVRKLKSRYRWCLTGTPIFNRVEDFGALLTFLRAKPFHDPRFFSSFISGPLNSSPLRALSDLRKLVQSISLRRRKGSVQEDLGIPGRENRVEEVILDDEERQRYDRLKQSWEKIFQAQSESTSRNISAQCVFQIILRLRQFCNHGLDLLPPSALAIFSDSVDEDSILDEVLEASETCTICMKASRPQPNGFSQASSLDCGHLVCLRCKKKTEDDLSLEDVECKLCLRVNETNNASRKATIAYPLTAVPSDPRSPGRFYKPSSKVIALMRNLHGEMIFTSPPLKSVIFSGWTKMLGLVEEALRNSSIPYERIDGSLSDQARRAALQNFRGQKGYCVLLASIGSAGVGLDLTVASRVHMLEPQWSPMAEEQALDRVHRMGQNQEVVMTRYIVKNSIEEYVVAVQGIKSSIINQSIEGNESVKPLNAKERFMKYLQEC